MLQPKKCCIGPVGFLNLASHLILSVSFVLHSQILFLERKKYLNLNNYFVGSASGLPKPFFLKASQPKPFFCLYPFILSNLTTCDILFSFGISTTTYGIPHPPNIPIGKLTFNNIMVIVCLSSRHVVDVFVILNEQNLFVSITV